MHINKPKIKLQEPVILNQLFTEAVSSLCAKLGFLIVDKIN